MKNFMYSGLWEIKLGNYFLNFESSTRLFDRSNFLTASMVSAMDVLIGRPILASFSTLSRPELNFVHQTDTLIDLYYNTPTAVPFRMTNDSNLKFLKIIKYV